MHFFFSGKQQELKERLHHKSSERITKETTISTVNKLWQTRGYLTSNLQESGKHMKTHPETESHYFMWQIPV